MNGRRQFFLFLGALTALRLAYVGQLELSPDEAYYYQWSQRLDWAYFSKGPGIAVALWLSTHLCGVSAFGVRVFSPLLALATSLLAASFARRLYGPSVAVWTVLLINLAPIFSAGALVMTIDPLSMFFWMAALYTVWLALERSPEYSGWWPATGALIGLGFLSKYTNAMELLSILLLLVCTPKYRRELRRRGFYLMLGVFAVFISPPLIWNAQHDWITLHHLIHRGNLDATAAPGESRFSILEFLTFLGEHFGVYSPLIFGGLLASLYWGWQRAGNHFKPRFLLAFAVPLLTLYFTISWKHAGEPNWTAPAMISLSILAVAQWHELAQEHRWARRYTLAALALGGLASLCIVDMEMLRRIGIPWPYTLDPTERLRGWRTAAETIGAARREFEAAEGRPVFLIAKKYGTASSLAFYLPPAPVEGPGHPPVYVPESPVPENQYYFWPRYDENVPFTPEAKPKDDYYTEEGGASPFLGRSALYITDRGEERPPSAIKRGFERVEMIHCIDFRRHGLLLRQLRIFACHNYQQVAL